MKLVVERDALFAALTRTAGVVSRRSTIQILQHVMLTTSDGVVTLTVTNLDIQATISVPAQIETPGTTTVAAERLREICARLPEGAEIAIDATDPLRVSIKAGRSKFSVGALPSTDFPLLTAPEGGSVLEMEAGKMLRLLTIGAASMGDHGAACCWLTRHETKVRAVSTNRKVLTLCDLPAPKKFKPEGGTMLTPDTVAIMLKALAAMKADERATLTVLPGKMVSAQLGAVSLIGRVVDGDYLPYQNVIPAKSEAITTVDTDGLIAMLSRARIAADYINVDLSAGAMEIQARDQTSGDHSAETGDCDWAGSDRRLCLTASWLLGVLGHVATESVVIQTDGPMTPVMLTETGASDWLGLVMPLSGSK